MGQYRSKSSILYISVATSPAGLNPQPTAQVNTLRTDCNSDSTNGLWLYFPEMDRSVNQVWATPVYTFAVAKNRNLVANYTKKPTGTITGSVKRV